MKTFLTGLEKDANVLKAIDSKEKADEFISSNDNFKRAFDSKVSKAVDNYKLNNYDNELKNGIEAGLKAELQKIADKDKKTPEQLRIEELEKEVQASKLKGLYQDRKDLTILELSKRDLDVSAANLLVSDSDERTRLNIDLFENTVKPYQEQIAELKQKLKIDNAQTGTPGNGNNFSGIKNPFKFDKDGNPGKDMDMQNKLFKENPTLYNQFLSEHRGTN
jgi:hypothetical protein